MSSTLISTAQNVNINYKIVGIGERILGFLIDGLLLTLYITIISYTIGPVVQNIDEDWTVYAIWSLAFLPAMFYSLLMHLIFNGQTLGKFVMNSRVVKTDGSPVNWSDYLVLWMMRIIDIWMFLGSIGILAIIFSQKKQRLGDAAAGTMVISTKRQLNITHTLLEEIVEDYSPVFPSVTRLTDRDTRLIKETYQLALRSADYKMLNLLRNRVESIINTDSDLYDKDFIAVVLKDYNYYTRGL